MSGLGLRQMSNPEKVVIGNAELWLGDCREILSGISPDVLITDPVWPNCPAGLLFGSENPSAMFFAMLSALNPVKRMTIVMRHDSDPRFLNPITLPFFRIQILPYVMPGYIGRKLGGDEIAYCFGEPIPSAPGQRVIPGYAPKVQPDGRKANGHPCSRSLQHFNFLVYWWSLPNETIIDPFMGSGTTIAAAMDHGRKAIGIEINPEYFDIACKRIELAQSQTRLFA